MTEWVREFDRSRLLGRDSPVALARSNATRFLENLDPGAVEMCVLGKVTPEQPRPWHTVEAAENVPCHLVEPNALRQLRLDIGHEPIEHIETRRRHSLTSENLTINLRQQIRVGIGGTADHDAIDMLQMRLRVRQGLDTAIDDDGEVRPPRFQPIDSSIVERRHLAVFLRAQALQPSLARMHDESLAASIGDNIDELVEAFLRILIVDADAAFDCDWYRDSSPHRRNTSSHQLRFRHQTSAEPSRLHPVRRATDIEIDLVITELFADARGLGELTRIAAPELERDRVL